MRSANLLWLAAEATGLNTLSRHRKPSRLLIACYHGVCDDRSEEHHWLLVRRSTFAKHLDYLRTRFEIRALDEAVTALLSGELRTPTAAVTFDDGYRNNFTEAWPELRARNLPATIFLATGFISTSASLWTTTLEYAVRGTSKHALDLRPWSGPRLRLGSFHERRVAGHVAKEFLKTLPAAHRREIVEAVLAWLGSAPVPAEFSFMTWEDVSELAAGGLIRFGAHTVNHEILSRLDEADIKCEIRESVTHVKSLGAAASRVFAFPNGGAQDFDLRAIRELEAVGVTSAVTTIAGVNSARTGALRLRRLVVDEGMTMARFRAEAGGVIAAARDFASTSAWSGAGDGKEVFR